MALRLIATLTKVAQHKVFIAYDSIPSDNVGLSKQYFAESIWKTASVENSTLIEYLFVYALEESTKKILL